jgi:hypothetical protein
MDNGRMDAAHAVASATLARIVRTVASAGVALDAKDALRLAVAATLRCGDDVVGLMFTRTIRGVVQPVLQQLQLSPDEYVALFGIDSSLRTTEATAEAVGGNGGQRRVKQLAQALEATLCEVNPSQAWASLATRCAASVAVSLEGSHDALVGVMGDVLRSDRRALDEVRAEEEEGSVDLLALATMVDALCESVVQ